jgi:tetratricopeptide (TPR) repeat protein
VTVASNPRIDDLRKRLEREPGSRLFAQLAEELRKAGELEEAIRLSQDGLERHSNYPSARMTLGRCLLDKRDLMAARREFESVLKGAPDNILACRFLADCLEGLGDLEGAAAQQRAALRLSPGDPQALQRLADLESKIAAGPGPAPREPSASPGPVPGATEEAGEPAPIPLAAVDDEAFELERPYEAPSATRGSGEPIVDAPSAPALPVEVGGLVEFEMPPTPEPEAAIVTEPREEPALEVPDVIASAPEVAASAPEPPILPPPAPVFPRAETPPPLSVPPFRKFEGEPPPPWVAPAPAASASASTEIASPTLAELYLNQGFTDRAIQVYRQVMLREPGNDRALARLTELETLGHPVPEVATVADVPGSPSPADPREARREGLQRAITGLEKLLASVRKE